MNVLILTPDAVGSTLLQRLLTIYMQFHEFDRPVINLHELTNGLEKYYSPEFNREIVSKKQVKFWGHYQTLEHIVELLNSVDHYKTSRLAHYMIRGRQDPIEQQIPFYRYLNDNFFVISCRRNNIFEHALSLSINAITKRLNVYDHQEKIDTFLNIYRDRTQIDERVFVSKLESFKDYITWSEQYFDIGSYFYYDDLINIERYILNLPIFDGQTQKINWEQKFNISFNDWNRIHFVLSDLGSLPTLEHRNMPIVTDGTDKKDASRTELKHVTSKEIMQLSNTAAVDFVEKNSHGYKSAQEAIEKMQRLDIIISPPPIKKQTLSEKISMIKNFDRCLEIYNSWILENPSLGKPITDDDLQQQINREHQFWRVFNTSERLSDQPTIPKLGYQSGDDL